MGGEKRGEKAHPGNDYRKRLVVAEEDVGRVGVFRRLEDRAEGTVGFSCWEIFVIVSFEDRLCQIMHQRRVSML